MISYKSLFTIFFLKIGFTSVCAIDEVNKESRENIWYEDNVLNAKLRAMEIHHPSYFAGFIETDLQLIDQIRHTPPNDKSPELAPELKKLHDFLNTKTNGKHRDEFIEIQKNLAILLRRHEDITILHWLSFAFQTAMVGNNFSTDEQGFFGGAGFNSLYDIPRLKLVEPFTVFLEKMLENGFDSDSKGVLLLNVDLNKEFEKVKRKSAFSSIHYPLPNRNSLGYFYLAYTFLNGIHPIPIPSENDYEKTHGMYMGPWAVFCHDFAHSEAGSIDHSAKQFAHNLLNHYYQILSLKVEDQSLPMTYEEKRRFKFSAMINPITSFAYKIHDAYYQSLVRVLELTLEELDPNQPLTDEKKAFWIGAFYYAHEKVPNMAYKYASRNLENLLRKSIQPYDLIVVSTSVPLEGGDKDDSAFYSNLFKTSYLTGKSTLSDSEIFDITKRLKLSRFQGMGSHNLFFNAQLNEKHIIDYIVIRNKFYIEVKIEMVSGRFYVFRENTNYDIQLNFEHDYEMLSQAQSILSNNYMFTLPVIPKRLNFENRETEYSVVAKSCADDLKKGLSYLQDYFVETTIKLSKQKIRGDRLTSIADQFAAIYDTALVRLRSALPSFIHDTQAFIETALTSTPLRTVDEGRE